MKKYLFYISQNYSFEVLRPLQNEIWRQGGQVAWFAEDANVNVNISFFRQNELVLNTLDEAIAFNPLAVFAPGNMIPTFLPGLKVAIFHGFVGFKKRKKDNLNYHFIIRDCFDLYCTHGESSTSTFNELAAKHKHFQVIETGYCKMDPYFSPSSVDKKVNERPVILFSSTFSPRMTQAPLLLPYIEILSRNAKWKWKVTFHPKMAKETVEAYKRIQHENLTFVETDELAPHMLEADLMVGDNSSMITDYLLLNKPVVSVNNESATSYLHNITNPENLESAIEFGLSRPPELMNAIRDFAQYTHPYTDGKSSERVLEAVEQAASNLHKIKKKPSNFLRNLKARKKFSYWTF
ncbi:MAG: CDP-glycerol glycerophosphotransferase (TagB/SpsB family) [Glaciecola sp.]|jgi:CDP-glycerol glycerophosphotransferase (TagB/SpsB family)